MTHIGVAPRKHLRTREQGARRDYRKV